MVRSLQDDRTRAGRTGERIRRQADGRQGQYRRQSGDAEQLCGAWYSDADPVQERQTRGDPGWRAAEEPAEGLDFSEHLTGSATLSLLVISKEPWLLAGARF